MDKWVQTPEWQTVDWKCSYNSKFLIIFIADWSLETGHPVAKINKFWVKYGIYEKAKLKLRHCPAVRKCNSNWIDNYTRWRGRWYSANLWWCNV